MRLDEYRAWGVRRVWFVDPVNRRIDVYAAGLSEVSAFRPPEYAAAISGAFFQ